LVTALVAILGGFDIRILGFAIPSLVREWHFESADFAPVLAIGLAGVGLAARWQGDAPIASAGAPLIG
jgi:hypothetical protein